MNGFANPSVNRLLEALLDELRTVLSDRLVGLYLYGSLAGGDFDAKVSDIDLLAAVESEVTEEECEALRLMHADLAKRYPEWDDRIEVQYASTSALRSFKHERRRMAVISPGEPFHVVEAGLEWLTNWYSVRKNGITLFGADPWTFIEPIEHAEFLEAVRSYALQWEQYVIHTKQSRPYQGYAILTMCRALRTLTTGEQVSKIQAARWFQARYPAYAALVGRALQWRQEFRSTDIEHEATYAETAAFVRYAAELVYSVPKS
jgi:predicted nucleotidyltransferase